MRAYHAAGAWASRGGRAARKASLGPMRSRPEHPAHCQAHLRGGQVGAHKQAALQTARGALALRGSCVLCRRVRCVPLRLAGRVPGQRAPRRQRQLPAQPRPARQKQRPPGCVIAR